jgi:hypothetical protein
MSRTDPKIPSCPARHTTPRSRSRWAWKRREHPPARSMVGVLEAEQGDAVAAAARLAAGRASSLLTGPGAKVVAVAEEDRGARRRWNGVFMERQAHEGKPAAHSDTPEQRAGRERRPWAQSLNGLAIPGDSARPAADAVDARAVLADGTR